jgi:hypothetical protein
LHYSSLRYQTALPDEFTQPEFAAFRQIGIPKVESKICCAGTRFVVGRLAVDVKVGATVKPWLKQYFIEYMLVSKVAKSPTGTTGATPRAPNPGGAGSETKP